MNYALITGGSSGIGFTLAEIFAKHNYNLLLVGRRIDQLQNAAENLLKKYRVDVQIFSADLSDSNSADLIFKFCIKNNLNICALVNNAGFAYYGQFKDIPPEKHLNLVNLNIYSPTALIGIFLPELIKNQGAILNVASTAAFQPGPLMSVYYASKAYILSLSEALRNELGPKGVKVSCLCPGPTKTAYQKLAGEDFLNSRLTRYSFKMEAQDVALAGFKGLMKNQAVIIPGFMNKFLAFWSQILPRNLIAIISRWTLEK